MKKVLATATFLFATTLASAWQYPAGTGGPPSSGPTWGLGRGTSEPKREKPPEFRTLTGVVMDEAESPVKDAVVYLKNRKTNKILTYVADAAGNYRFPNLSRKQDYEVYAELKGQKSPVKTLSSFDNRVNVKLNLYVEPGGAKDAEKKEEQAAKQDSEKVAEKATEKAGEKPPEKPAEKDQPVIDDRVHPPESPN